MVPVNMVEYGATLLFVLLRPNAVTGRPAVENPHEQCAIVFRRSNLKRTFTILMMT
jgi:hypothetical protein